MEQLLSTKLFIPPTRPEFIPRPRLIKRLNGGLHRKLTLISAPAGFGKTTLVTEWLDNLCGGAKKSNRIKILITWLSLDEGDNDSTRFLTYFISALHRIEGMDATFGKEAVGMLQSPQPPPVEVVLISLINEITTIPDRIILVLDDYHLIDAKIVNDALSFLLENIPPQLHLVIATREDPYLPLSRLRARGQLTELRAADLRFTLSETTEFLNQMIGINLSEEDISALEIRTEGWIAGLQLAALALQGKISLQGHADTSKMIQSFTGSHRFVLDYLVEEVLHQQPETVQTFLLCTSILDRLCGPLCDAVRFGKTKSTSSSVGTTETKRDNGQTILEVLERSNLLIVPLDDKRQWYRYHHLFADVLQAHLMEQQPNQVATLHLRASEWYEHNDFQSDAIRHALAADDFERAANLAELTWPNWSGNFQSITWLGWVRELPDELVSARPVLSLSYALAFLNAGDLEAAEARLKDVERWLEPSTYISDQPETPATEMVVVDEEQFRLLPASLAFARAYHAQAIGDVVGTVKYTQRVLNLVPEGDHQWREDATMLMGLAYWASGNLEAAHRTFSDGLASASPLDAIIGTFVLADMKMTLGHLREATRICEFGLKLAKEYDQPNPMGTEDVYSGISHIHREQGDLEAAAQDLLIGKKLGEKVELPDWQYRWYIAQARLKETRGELDDALDLLDEAERLYVRTPLPKVRPIAAMKARVWVKQGQLAEALGWARERGLSVDDDLSYLSEYEHITLTRVLIAKYKSNRVDDSIQDVLGFIERLLQAAEDGKRTGSVIEILVLQALAREAQKDISPALESLDRALKLAEPEGYCRIFVDEGQPMTKLLNEATKKGVQPDYSHKLLAVFESEKVAVRLQHPLDLVESLTARELEVLQLVARGLTNREISERLYLALDTIKGHNRRIYGKLGVKKRIDAVERARELGLL